MRIDFAGLCFSDAPGLHFAHDPGYMLLSYIIAATGSYTALKLVDWLRHCPAGSARFWHLAASVTLGGSIWAMHFMGMLAVRIALPMSFEPKRTLLSLAIAVGLTALGLRIALGGAHSNLRIGAAGVVLGLGVAAMHYVGMAALRLPGSVAYAPDLWAVSVLIAVGAAVAALCLALHDGRHRPVAALVMAAAICGMHYTGMAAAVIRFDPLIAVPSGLAAEPLAIAVAGITLALLLLVLVSVNADRRLSDVAAREARALRQANTELQDTQREIVARLCAAGEFRDQDTGAHVTRMANVAHRLALAAGLDMGFADQILAAAPLHDIGKVGTPDAVLFKRGALLPHEQKVMREHVGLGERILGGSELPLLKLAAEIARNHHEKWDGSGYPSGLSGEEIPISSRIVAVADVFDALLSERPYKAAWCLDRVIAHMRNQAGKHFDPALVDVLLRDMPAIHAIWHRYANRAPPPRQPIQVSTEHIRNKVTA